jgi:hypothetical protein
VVLVDPDEPVEPVLVDVLGVPVEPVDDVLGLPVEPVLVEFVELV